MFYILLMGNHLDSSKEDLIRMKKVFAGYKVFSFENCFPAEKIKWICKKINENDSLFIYFSGHGKIIGKRIHGKMHMLSSWVNPDNSCVDSYTIDTILSNINCEKMFLISDTCHGGNFGNFYTGKTKLTFISSSDIIHQSNEYKSADKKPAGILTYLFEEYSQEILYSEKNILYLAKDIYKKYNLKKNPILKKFNT